MTKAKPFSALIVAYMATSFLLLGAFFPVARYISRFWMYANGWKIVSSEPDPGIAWFEFVLCVFIFVDLIAVSGWFLTRLVRSRRGGRRPDRPIAAEFWKEEGYRWCDDPSKHASKCSYESKCISRYLDALISIVMISEKDKRAEGP